MLIEKPIKEGSIITCKLTSGEEIIARFESGDETHIVISKPSVLAQGPQGLGMVPWIVSAQAEKITLNKSNIVAQTSTDEEIAKSYIQATSSIQIV
jgi:hypothetical protein